MLLLAAASSALRADDGVGVAFLRMPAPTNVADVIDSPLADFDTGQGGLLFTQLLGVDAYAWLVTRHMVGPDCWLAARPPAPVDPDRLPHVSDLLVNPATGALLLAVVGADSLTGFDIFRKVVGADETFDLTPWTLVASNVRADAAGRGLWSETPPARGAGTDWLVYRVEPGLPAAENGAQPPGAESTSPTNGADAVCDGAATTPILPRSDNPPIADPVLDAVPPSPGRPDAPGTLPGAMTNAGDRAVSRPAQPGSVVYVDAIRGWDGWSGCQAKTLADDGPKRTILAGLEAASSGRPLKVRGGDYSENVDVRGLKVNLRVVGRVTLQTGRIIGRPTTPPLSLTAAITPTNVVSTVLR